MSIATETVLAALNAAGCAPREHGARLFEWEARCPAHTDSTPSLQVTESEDGRVLLRCWAGCSNDAIVAALKLTFGHLYPDSKVYGAAASVPLTRRARPVVGPPVANKDLVARIMEHARANLRVPAAAPFLKKRGVTPDLCDKYAVGFMPWIKFAGWRGAIPNVWVIPVPDASGEVRALKLHRENPPAGFSKGMWGPVGTEPKEKPRHGWATLWPPPETFEPEKKLFLVPGELKALAVLGTGNSATAPTSGESLKWTEDMIGRLRGRVVCVVYDDDAAGKRFLDSTVAALRSAVAKLSFGTFGRKG